MFTPLNEAMRDDPVVGPSYIFRLSPMSVTKNRRSITTLSAGSVAQYVLTNVSFTG